MKQRLLIVSVALLVASACSKKIDGEPKINDPIVGMWVVDSDKTTAISPRDFYAFRSDGTVTYGLYTPTPPERFDVDSKSFEIHHNVVTADGRQAISIGAMSIRVKFSNPNTVAITTYTAEIYATYRRVSDWNSLGYPEHIMEQMPK